MAAVYPNQLAQRLTPLPPLVLLWGEDAGAIRQAAAQVVVATGVDASDPFAAEKITLNDLLAAPTRLVESAQTLSFTSPHRLIEIRGVSGDEPAASVATLTQAVKDTLSFPLEAVTIVLPMPRLLEKTSALVKVVEAHPNALSVRFFVDSARDISQWLQSEINTSGGRIEADALHLMAAGLGADRDIARREVEKLLLYAGAESPITVAHVEASLAGATPSDVFRLAESVAARNAAQTDFLLQSLIQQGEDLNMAFSIVVRQLATLKTAVALESSGAPELEVLKAGNKVRAPREAQQAFLAAVRRYPPARLESLAGYTMETLATARSGVADGTLVLQRAILALSV